MHENNWKQGKYKIIYLALKRPERYTSTYYLALKTGSESGDGCVFRVYLSSKPSEERPGTCRSLKHSIRRNYFKCKG